MVNKESYKSGQNYDYNDYCNNQLSNIYNFCPATPDRSAHQTPVKLGFITASPNTNKPMLVPKSFGYGSKQRTRQSELEEPGSSTRLRDENSSRAFNWGPE